VRNGTTWTQQAYLKASNTGSYDYFGYSVSISGDTIVIGASEEDSSATGVNGDQNNDDSPSSGAAYVFVREGATWRQQAYLKARDNQNGLFGCAVTVVDEYIVAGQYRGNTATVFQVIKHTGATTTDKSPIEYSDDDNAVLITIIVMATLVAVAIVASVIVVLLFRRKGNNAHNAGNTGSVSLISAAKDEMSLGTDSQTT
jgi:hypothetical protein